MVDDDSGGWRLGHDGWRLGRTADGSDEIASGSEATTGDSGVRSRRAGFLAAARARASVFAMRTRLGLALVCLLLVSPAAAQDLQDEPRELDFVGFQQFKEVSRVFVRTNDTARYHVNAGRDGVVTLTLENTGCTVANHLRHLDTHFFDGPVVLIQPKLIEGPSNSIEIDIYLRRGVTVRQSQKDNVINLDFPRD